MTLRQPLGITPSASIFSRRQLAMKATSTSLLTTCLTNSVIGLCVAVTDLNRRLGFNPSAWISPMTARNPAKAFVLDTATVFPLRSARQLMSSLSLRTTMTPAFARLGSGVRLLMIVRSAAAPLASVMRAVNPLEAIAKSNPLF